MTPTLIEIGYMVKGALFVLCVCTCVCVCVCVFGCGCVSVGRGEMLRSHKDSRL